jgi:hypothetical protein
MPPKTIQVVQPTMPLSFGNFTAPVFSSGTVTVSEAGIRTATGDVFLMGGTVQPGIFEFNLQPGRLVTVSYPPQIYVAGMGPNGGRLLVDHFTLKVEGVIIEQSGTGFIRFHTRSDSHFLHRVYVGGQLHVGTLSSNPRGCIILRLN